MLDPKDRVVSVRIRSAPALCRLKGASPPGARRCGSGAFLKAILRQSGKLVSPRPSSLRSWRIFRFRLTGVAAVSRHGPVAAGIDDAGDRPVQAVQVRVGLGYQPAPEHQAPVAQLRAGGDDLAAEGTVPVGERDQVKRPGHAITGLQGHHAGITVARQPVNGNATAVSTRGDLTAEVTEKAGPAHRREAEAGIPQPPSRTLIMITAGIAGNRHRAARIILRQKTPRHHALEYLSGRDNPRSLTGQRRDGPLEDRHLMARSRQLHSHGTARHREWYPPRPARRSAAIRRPSFIASAMAVAEEDVLPGSYLLVHRLYRGWG